MAFLPKKKEKKMRKLIFIFFVLMNSYSFASCKLFNEDTPIQEGGRVKPYYVYATETLKYLIGKTKFENKKAKEVICLIYKNSIELDYTIQHNQLREFLNVEKSISSTDAESKKELIKAEYLQQKLNTSYKKALNLLLNKITIYQNIKSGMAFSIFIDHQGEKQWAPVALFKDFKSLRKKVKASKNLYIDAHNDTFLLELKFSKSHLFSYSMLLAIFAIFVLVLTKKSWLNHFFIIATLLLQVIGITLRVIISGRAPITNMYETVLFSGFGALFIGYIIFFVKKEKLYLLAGLGYNVLCLFMMMFANNMLSSSISPLVPVLRDNFWLSTHVTTIILSYAALALSWMLANIALFRLRFGKIEKRELNDYFNHIYNCIKVGVVLLSAGIILGGIWADYSWGRFWGWDPKETWSLIVLLFYMAILHGKYSNWINNKRFITLSAFGFLTVMMAWFGVNYILASGLHSYGFSEGGAIFLGTFFATQIIFILVTTIRLPKSIN